MAEGGQRRRVTLIESDDPPERVREAMPAEQLAELDIFVRSPDRKDTREIAHTARLCSCRRICVAIIEQ